MLGGGRTYGQTDKWLKDRQKSKSPLAASVQSWNKVYGHLSNSSINLPDIDQLTVFPAFIAPPLISAPPF